MDNLGNTIQSILNSPEGINQIASIAHSLSGDASSDAPVQESRSVSEPTSQNDDLMSILGQIDPNAISTVAGIIREYNNTDDRRISLLNALKLYLHDNDSGHIDKAMQIMRLSKVIKHAFSSGIGGGSANV